MSLLSSKLIKYGRKTLSITITLRRNIMDAKKLMDSVKSCIFPLSADKHKGQAGRIGVIGGSVEYTGAPFFAGISSLKVGADLVHIFCASSAAPVIKSYSPELIVHPLLDEIDALYKIGSWLDRLHVLVIGPGLGRDYQIFNTVSSLIKLCKTKNIPLVIDADGLYLITEDLNKSNILHNYPVPVILTPNKIEYARLSDKIEGDISKIGNSIIILQKGHSDKLLSSQPEYEWESSVGGSNRRCGGQGDLLSGSIATLFHWTLSKEQNPLLAASIACYGASRLIRLCNEKAFNEKGRSMLAGDMIGYIHESFVELFGSH